MTMVRTQIQLTEAQADALKRMAAERAVSLAALIREAVSGFLEGEHVVDEGERRRRARSAAGRFRSGRGDLAAEHDRYLDEAYGG